MSGEIQKFDQPRPKVKILGAADTQESKPLQILDRNTQQEPVSPEVHAYFDEVLPEDSIRIEKRDPSEPQVRIRSSDQEAWEKAKRDV